VVRTLDRVSEAPTDPSQYERVGALLAEMEAEAGPIPPELLAEASALWGDGVSLDRDQVVCLRVAEFLAERRGIALVGDLSIPEREDRTNPAVS
jgi:hypothetical protein